MNAVSWRRSLNCDGFYGAALLAGLALLLACAAGGERTLLALRYERSAIAAGEWWRLLGAHLVHLGWLHLLLDALALCLLWALYARAFSVRAWLLVCSGAIVAIDAGLWWLSPAVQWYAGISGLLHGIWAAGAVQAARRREFAGWLLLLALALKLLREYQLGAGVLIAALPVVTQAHRYGALGALLVVAALWLRSPARAA